MFATLLIAKTARALSRLTGRGSGSAVTGLVAEKLDPNITAKLARRLPQGCVVITGTNGKTTATKMLAAILEADGRRVLTNSSGSNLTRGLASRLVEAASLTARLPYDIGVFEVDEATMPSAVRLLRPKVAVVLNLFRDQLDRYGELDQTAAIIGRALGEVRGDVWLNADDPLVASLMGHVGHDAKLHYFGVERSDVRRLEHDVAADSNHCPLCGEALEYSQNYFGHIGHYHCPMGHFTRPRANVWLEQSGAKTELGDKAGQHKLELSLPGLYNAYNALAAAAVATSLGVGLGSSAKSVAAVEAAFGRVESFDFNGRRVVLLLIKNPTGFNQVIQTFLTAKSADPGQAIMIAINDLFADGRDVSWLWDVGFEEIDPAAKIVASGIRADDLAVRLKYAGRPVPPVDSNLLVAFGLAVKAAGEGGTVYVCLTYTAMLSLRRALTKRGDLKPWA